MNVLFLTILDFYTLEQSNIYTDLMNEFVKNDHKVFIISPMERKHNKKTYVIKSEDVIIVKKKIGNIQKTNLIEKGISTLLIDLNFRSAINRYFSNIKFDLILYSTPPINFSNTISFIKRRDKAKTYLLLKDIFPQNALDIGLLKKSGLLGFIYKYFKSKEKKLYLLSDVIGCMSEGNVRYLVNHYPYLDSFKVEVNPNTINPIVFDRNRVNKKIVLEKYHIQSDKIIFTYGGNLGKPQGIDFLCKCIIENEKSNLSIFVIVGNGTEYKKIKSVIENENIKNSYLIPFLPKEDFDNLLCVSDVGMVFLDYRFTIPNYPSRILSYLQASLPILLASDDSTDLKDDIHNWGIGLWAPSNNVNLFMKHVDYLTIEEHRVELSKNSAHILQTKFNTKLTYNSIVNHIAKENH